MKRFKVDIGDTFTARVGRNNTIVVIESKARDRGYPMSSGWIAFNLNTGRRVHIQSRDKLGARLYVRRTSGLTPGVRYELAKGRVQKVLDA